MGASDVPEHYCILCAREGKRVFGPYGFTAWPEADTERGRAIGVVYGGRVWACDTHAAAVKDRSQERRGDRLTGAGSESVQPQSRLSRGISRKAPATGQGSLF